MTGQELYNKLSQRDYSGSEQDVYAQLLQTLHHNLFLNGQVDEFYELLQKANNSGKKLSLIESDNDVLVDEYFIDDITLV